MTKHFFSSLKKPEKASIFIKKESYWKTNPVGFAPDTEMST